MSDFLDEIRAAQHNDQTYASDAAFAAFLAEVPADAVLRDRLPRTEIERRHLARIQGRTAA